MSIDRLLCLHVHHAGNGECRSAGALEAWVAAEFVQAVEQLEKKLAEVEAEWAHIVAEAQAAEAHIAAEHSPEEFHKDWDTWLIQ